jgi:hypothetical protein
MHRLLPYLVDWNYGHLQTMREWTLCIVLITMLVYGIRRAHDLHECKRCGSQTLGQLRDQAQARFGI